MVMKPSTMVPLGTTAPDFRLPNPATGALVSRSDFDDASALLLMFICNHCPFVIHVQEAFQPLVDDYADRGLAVVAINANDADNYPQDGPEQMKALVESKGWTFPFLFDASQDVAKAYRAACTPDFLLYDSHQKLAYRGQLDEARPGNDVPVSGNDLRAAIEAVLAGSPAPADQRPSVGCNIKWTPGQEPDYF